MWGGARKQVTNDSQIRRTEDQMEQKELPRQVQSEGLMGTLSAVQKTFMASGLCSRLRTLSGAV